ncbi:MAG: paraquat-inducible protein A [Colwellia sp.]|nr:paraquat-inducible protein A [Colwellia sp.]MCW8865830.1 paraquat-inducible protein A [Colwellia sp.]MCW9082168.1 paraquat-inducible protein A [Colwellia sp.]
MTNSANKEQLIACQQCDALYEKPELKQGQSAKCTRCGSTIEERKVNSIERSFHWSLAGIMLLVPAILLPIMGVTLAGQYHHASLLDCIVVLIDRGFFMIATLVFLFAIAVPVVRLFGAFYITYSFKFNKLKPSLLYFFRAFHHLDNWAMLNVFMLGIVVSMYKLLDDTELSVNMGLLAFILWLISSTMASSALDQDYIWQKLEDEFVD